ncbi:hypothetical protein A4X13_0g4523 [Tilletia indica]|uniref:Uncharacterized protein n=1 Tax=Tilletia indica TaxID=43049 RepID=A0A8T8SY80_9BASI|nr:hypothetical protein A4X13_0g4523 [Tilletia indica]
MSSTDTAPSTPPGSALPNSPELATSPLVPSSAADLHPDDGSPRQHPSSPSPTVPHAVTPSLAAFGIHSIQQQHVQHSDTSTDPLQAVPTLGPIHIPPRDAIPEAANLHLVNYPPPAWHPWLFGLSRDWQASFGALDEPSHVYPRRRPKGLKIFDQYVRSSVCINSLPVFQHIFQGATANVLNGMCFDNVVIAGGIVSACVNHRADAGVVSPTSDVDVFLYGVGAEAANSKVLAIETTLRSNVPDFESHYRVERTITTISFVPIAKDGAFRKIQIILRLFTNIGEVLASFDFDQTAIGFDGSEVWMEMRAVRALICGYSFITAKMLRSTSPARIVKYTTRGYGLVLRTDGMQSVHNPAAQGPSVGQIVLCAQEAYDKVRRLIDTARQKNAQDGLRLRRPNMAHMLSQLRYLQNGGWLHSFSNFIAFSSLWDQAALADASRREFIRATSGRQGDYAPFHECLEYDHDLLRSDVYTAEEWAEVFSTSGQIPPGTLKSLAGHDFWTKTGHSVDAVTSRPLMQFMLLPVGLCATLQATGSAAFHAGSLDCVGGDFKIKDDDGVEFEPCVWTHSFANMWQPASGIDRFAHQTLRDIAITTAWTLTRTRCGAPWSALRFGKIVMQSFKNARLPQDIAHDKALIRAWLGTP